MTGSDLFTRVDFLNWRDSQLEEITLQAETAFPELLKTIDAKIDEAGTTDLAWSEFQIRDEISEICSTWAEEQAQKALAHTEDALSDLKEKLALEFTRDPDLNDRLAAIAPALASAGLAAASIAAIPTVVSFATVSSSVLAIVGVSYVSWPLFTVGAVALGATALISRSLFDTAVENWRESLRARAHTHAGEIVFGLGAPVDQRTILEDIQALAINAAANSMDLQ